VVEVKSRRVGGATYQVPVEVRPERRTALAMRWLISYSRDRNEKSMAEKLAAEVISASKGEGNAVRRRKTRTAWPTQTRRSRTIAGSRTLPFHNSLPCWWFSHRRGFVSLPGRLRRFLLKKGPWRTIRRGQPRT